MLSSLAAYYGAKGIAPEDFRCHHVAECSAESPRFTTAKASFVGTEYEKGNGPRLLFLSLDSGSAEVDPRRKTIEAVRYRELRENVAALHKNKHWYRTHELAWVLLRHFHPRLTIDTTSPYFAHVNSAKCCQNKHQRGKANRTLFANCRGFIPGELAILRRYAGRRGPRRSRKGVPDREAQEKGGWWGRLRDMPSGTRAYPTDPLATNVSPQILRRVLPTAEAVLATLRGGGETIRGEKRATRLTSG